MFYNCNSEKFEIRPSNNCFKLYHKSSTRYSKGLTYIGKFKSKQAAEEAAKKYSS